MRESLIHFPVPNLPLRILWDRGFNVVKSLKFSPFRPWGMIPIVFLFIFSFPLKFQPFFLIKKIKIKINHSPSLSFSPSPIPLFHPPHFGHPNYEEAPKKTQETVYHQAEHYQHLRRRVTTQRKWRDSYGGRRRKFSRTETKILLFSLSNAKMKIHRLIYCRKWREGMQMQKKKYIYISGYHRH